MADIFNAFNSNAAVGATSNAGEPPAAINTTYGSAWLRPLNILQARYVKFGAQIHLLERCLRNLLAATRSAGLQACRRPPGKVIREKQP